MIGLTRIVKRLCDGIDGDGLGSGKQRTELGLLPFAWIINALIVVVFIGVVLSATFAYLAHEHNRPVLDLSEFGVAAIKMKEEDQAFLLFDKVIPPIYNAFVLILGAGMGVYGIAYSLLSYKQAKKVETQIRGTISTYEDFVDEAINILHDALDSNNEDTQSRKHVVLLLMFPYYGVLRDIRDLSDEMHGLLQKLRVSRCKTEMILPDSPFLFAVNLFTEAKAQGASLAKGFSYDGLLDDLLLLHRHLEREHPQHWNSRVHDALGSLKLPEKTSHIAAEVADFSTSHETYKVTRVPYRMLKGIYYQIVWTKEKAVIVFLPPSDPFTQSETNAYGFHTEDKEMIRIIKSLAVIAKGDPGGSGEGLWGQPELPEGEGKIVRLADKPA